MKSMSLTTVSFLSPEMFSVFAPLITRSVSFEFARLVVTLISSTPAKVAVPADTLARLRFCTSDEPSANEP